MPLVSIIMPVYNKEKYVKKSIQSILDQTFTDFELIIVNDGSTDRSLEICESFKDSRITIISVTNGGVSKARNIGLDNAKGEWIWFVDSDDLPSRIFLNNIFFNNLDMKNIDIIVGNFIRNEPNGKQNKVTIKEYGLISYEYFPDIFMKYQYANGFWGYLWNKVIKRSIIVNGNCRFKEGLTLAEDLRFMVELYRKNLNIYSIDCVAMTYTVDSINSSYEKEINYYDQLCIQLYIKNWLIEEKNNNIYLDKFKEIISNYSSFIIFYAFENKKDYLSQSKIIIESRDIKTLLSTKNISKTMRPIVFCLKHNLIVCMSLYLKIRYTIREVYRYIKNI